MSEYKKMSDWAKEIGLVSGMKFENDSNIFHFTIISIVDNECIIIKSNTWRCDYTANIDGFEYEYKLIYDPRSENKIEKETQMNLREQLQKNSEEFYSNSIKTTTEYKDFETKLRYELIAYSKKYGEREYTYNFFMSNKDLELKMVKVFCAENGLTFKHDFYSVISW